MSETMTVKVDTGVLRNVSTDVNTNIAKMENIFKEIGEVVARSGSYWEGNGEQAYVKAYQKKKEKLEISLKRFQENVTDLQTIAGIYEASERDIVSIAKSLPVDVIK